MSNDLRAPQPLPPPPPHGAASHGATQATKPPSPSPSPSPSPVVPRLGALESAGWIAILGASLVLLAAILVVTSHWQSISDPWKAAGLVAATGAIVMLAERARRRIPTTSSVIAHLGAALTCPAGIAATAAAGGIWPVCVTVGGLIAAATMEIQLRRWNGRLMEGGQVIGICVGLAGVAALTPIPVGVLAAGAAAVMLAVRRPPRAVGLAYLAGAAPLLSLVASAGWGEGTFRRIGAHGADLRWGAPLAGLAAAGVIVAAARRDRAWHRRGAWALAFVNVWVGLTSWEFWQTLSDWLHEQQVRPVDVGMLTITAALFALARWGSSSTADRNVFHAVALAFCGLWSVVRIADTPSSAWVSISFAIGLGSAAIGARSRDRVLLAGGTAITVATVIATLHGQLSQLPGWAWLSIGGAGLVALAARLEQRSGSRSTDAPDPQLSRRQP